MCWCVMGMTYDKRKAAGLCPCCGNPPSAGKISCDACIKKGATRSIAAVARRKAAKLCRCGSTLVGGEPRCKACRDRVARRKQSRRISGKCPRCGADPVPSQIRCAGCKARANRNELNKQRTAKAEAIQHYGGVCVECGECEPMFLTIDHINGGGGQHRKKLNKYGGLFFVWLKRNGFPEGYRTLCFNCNCRPLRSRPFSSLSQNGKYLRRLRHKVINAYGGKCKCCGLNDETILTLDHPNNDGGEHRRQLGGTQKVYMWLIRNGFPPGYRLLCWNCNSGRKCAGGICPHVSQSQPHGTGPINPAPQGKNSLSRPPASAR